MAGGISTQVRDVYLTVFFVERKMDLGTLAHDKQNICDDDGNDKKTEP